MIVPGDGGGVGDVLPLHHLHRGGDDVSYGGYVREAVIRWSFLVDQ